VALHAVLEVSAVLTAVRLPGFPGGERGADCDPDSKADGDLAERSA